MKRRELLKTTLVLPFAGLLKAVPVTTAVDFVDVPCGVPVRKGMKYLTLSFKGASGSNEVWNVSRRSK